MHFLYFSFLYLASSVVVVLIHYVQLYCNSLIPWWLLCQLTIEAWASHLYSSTVNCKLCKPVVLENFFSIMTESWYWLCDHRPNQPLLVSERDYCEVPPCLNHPPPPPTNPGNEISKFQVKLDVRIPSATLSPPPPRIAKLAFSVRFAEGHFTASRRPESVSLAI